MRKRKLWIIAVSLVLAWFIANATARVFVHYLASHYIRQLEENDPAKRAEVLRKLRYMQLWATPPSAEMLRHGDVRERRASLLACEQVVAICVDNFRTMSCTIPIVPGRGAAESAFDEMGGALTDALEDVDSQVRVGAAHLILFASEFPTPARRRAVVVLSEAMKDPDPKIRRSLVEAMCPRTRYDGLPCDGDDVLPILSEAVKDPDATVRRAAVESLARGGRVEAAKPVIEAMTDRDPSVRRAAERAYLGTRQRQGLWSGEYDRSRPEVQAAFHADIPYFINWWKNGDPEADPQDRQQSKDRAIIALHLARGPEVIPTMVEARDVGALVDLAKDADCLAALHHHIPALKQLLRDSLSFYVEKGEDVPIESILRRLGPEAEAARSQLIARLMDQLGDPDPSLRKYVAGELGYFAKSSPDVLRALRSVEKADPEPWVREAARESLDHYIGH
jgi:HEAT repeat protein